MAWVANFYIEHVWIFCLFPKEFQEELFQSSTDPTEVRNVLSEQSEVADEMRGLVKGYLERPAPPWGVSAREIELDEMELNQLRALGYAVP